MKKALLFLMALAVAGGAFALDVGNGLTLEGEAAGGIQVVTKDDDTKIALYNDDAGANRVRLIAGYSGGIIGAKLRLESKLDYFQISGIPTGSDISGNIAGEAALLQGYGWANLAGGKVVLAGGDIFDALYGTGGVIDKDVGVGPGVRVEVKPIEGLSFAVGLPLSAEANDIGDQFENIRFGASYTSKAFTGKAAFAMAQDKDFTALFAFDIPLGAVGINITGAYSGEKPVNADAAGSETFRIAPLFTFKVGDIGAFARADITIPDGDVGFAFRVGGSYKAGPTEPFLWVGSDNIADFDTSGLYIRVGTPFNLGNGLTLSLYEHLNRLGASGDIVNTVQVNLAYAF
ncbi:MAG: hypothetical protein MdMp014T_1368 [Treponematales bacterium]